MLLVKTAVHELLHSFAFKETMDETVGGVAGHAAFCSGSGKGKCTFTTTLMDDSEIFNYIRTGFPFCDGHKALYANRLSRDTK